jgi:bifunctional UDP-N-acetylglucosamine pyrophosphorylase/glucosamine-1-phosphate N-acetyltransferase
MADTENHLNVLVLAAGLGTRMRSDMAKVLHRLDGRPLVNHVVRTAAALAPKKVFIVVGHQADEVRKIVTAELGEDVSVEFVVQERQIGTGDAVNVARPHLENDESEVLILSGDVPMIRPETLAALVQKHRAHRGRGASCTILSVKLADPTGYGRIVRDSQGIFSRIVEQRDASPEEQEIKEINSGIYCFDTVELFRALSHIKNHNAQGEYYLTDVPPMLAEIGGGVAVYQHADAWEVEGVNNRVQLAALESFLNTRTINRLMLDHGVTFVDPKAAYISERASIGRDTVIHPNVTVEGESVIGDGCEIRPGTRIVNSRIAHGVEIRDNCLIVDSEIGSGCAVGPMAHMRGHAVMRDGSKIGNFVEMKKTTLGKNSKAAHLTYLGDATIGENTNIGAGVITCNYDGKNKHETHIGDKVKIGSDTMLVAPVRVGDGAVTGAGSVVTKDIPENKLAVGAPARVVKDLSASDKQ